MKRLTEIERETLSRLAEEFGLKVLSEHTGVSQHALKKAMEEQEGDETELQPQPEQPRKRAG